MRSAGLLVLAAAAVLAAACADRGPTASPPSTGFDLPGLGLRVDGVPAGLVRAEGQPRLVAADPERGGRVLIGVDPAEQGVNLVQAVHQHQAWLEAQPEGRYFGAQELVTPLGTAFWSRGRWRADDGREIEEAIALVLHPDRTRIVRLGYRYPGGEDSSERVTELLELLGALEAPPEGGQPSAG